MLDGGEAMEVMDLGTLGLDVTMDEARSRSTCPGDVTSWTEPGGAGTVAALAHGHRHAETQDFGFW